MGNRAHYYEHPTEWHQNKEGRADRGGYNNKSKQQDLMRGIIRARPLEPVPTFEVKEIANRLSELMDQRDKAVEEIVVSANTEILRVAKERWGEKLASEAIERIEKARKRGMK